MSSINFGVENIAFKSDFAKQMKTSQRTWFANFQFPATNLSFSNASHQKKIGK